MRLPNKTENVIAAAKFGKYAHSALHALAGTEPSRPGVAYALKPGVHVCGGRLRENDAMDGFAIEIEGMSSERGGMLACKLKSRRENRTPKKGGAVTAAGVRITGDAVGVGEATGITGSSKALRRSECLIAQVWGIGRRRVYAGR